ncbi:hypothetical protein IPC1288_08730 [Pseudomonas aeruginosa]|uniref:BREX system P-loop protein BrxC n=1 Tax=Pseudomonas aeruginosa TaxID=287 RepID=UPI000D378A63|nr:BREX system P-loop protein BrxC [Pseudomonas aeruginosa]MBG4151751.1 BREX system P-loop protein BrxC [Pseudomonas aeruginosa]MBM2553720.1 BREX system P-loop protein BrxC [Pseudomonas aeruginosa]PTZ98639.1 BREX system P-loop protein BrxC [Pseudomonas aeruginosa]RPM64729.1 hypothetical protein IPC1288_08730 [Pseudomonas aeruginosa]HBO2840674.1 BREX system P-loop protein BrxC [Pseudomonas aeruginosa]
MLNREIYLNDPLENRLANNGVAEVKDDLSEQALNTLRYELKTFVCEGEYQAGMDKILSTYLRNLGSNHEQPGVWISGFFGSGKSHMAKMLRTLWVDQAFPDGLTARHIANLPQNVADAFKELSIQSRRYGGLHAASGTLGAGANNNVRLALLGIIFKSAGLPEQYHQARFVLWLREQGYFDAVKQAVEDAGKPWERELSKLYVSPLIANALLTAYPDMASDAQGVHQLLKGQFPTVTDVTNDQMVQAIADALDREGQFPLTLVVLDEVQQYVGNDVDRAHMIQEVVETCCKHSAFGNRLLFIATGQNALSGMPNLMRLMGRFQIPIMLSDTDVESVIRKVILQKVETARAGLQALLTKHLGEISRHLRGTKVEYHQDDEKVMLADYPLLPVRRRFWEKVLRIVDTTGTVSQLRNQLKVIHEAAKATAEKELGNIVPGDFIYQQIAPNLLQTGVISKEDYERIAELSAGDDDQQLQSRLLSLILLIGKLPTDSIADCGVRATADMLADLLVDNLNQGKDELRARIPVQLEAMAKNGQLMAMETSAGVEYRLQTQESAQWYDTFRQQEADLRGNMQRVENFRIDLLHKQIKSELVKVRVTQGACKENRQVIACFDAEVPKDANQKIYLWVQDGWSLNESSFLAEARKANPDLPTLYLYIPARNRSELNNAIIHQEAADATLSLRGMPNTEAGKDARKAMETRQRDAQKQVDQLLKEILSGVQVLQAGGAEVDGNSIAERIQTAAQASVVRLYREFDMADSPHWAKVYDRARKDGGQNALEAVGFSGDTEKHPVCATLLRYIGASKKGNEIRDQFAAAPYGWQQDTIDGALFALVAAGVLRATDASGNALTAQSLERQKLTQSTFRPETVTIRPVDLIKIRGLISSLGIDCPPGEEQARLPALINLARELHQAAGGEAPAPARPDASLIDEIAKESGNTQLKLVLDNKDAIKPLLDAWRSLGEQLRSRRSDWDLLQTLLRLSKGLAFGEKLCGEVDAIKSNRSLLAEPNPLESLISTTVSQLREAINHHFRAFHAEYQKRQAELTADSHWQQLSAAQQNELLARRGLVEPEALSLGSREEVIDSLETTSLEQWTDRKDSLAAKFESARQEAVKLLQPKVQHVSLPKRTFENEAQLRQWLTEIEAQLLAKLAEGPVMV